MARTSRKKAPKGNGTQKRNAKRNGPTLRGRMARIRNELSGLRVANGNGDLFRSTIEQLEALAGEIAEAADRVMTAGEAIQKSADTIAARTKDRTTKTHVNRIVKNTGDLFEACSFQDITGQRIGKVVEELKFVNDKLASMVDIWGPEAISREPLGDADAKLPAGEHLHGPALHGEGASQAEIDKLFD